jgi:NAD+ diphosphatase
MHRESIYKRYIPATGGAPADTEACWFAFSSSRLLVSDTGKAVPSARSLEEFGIFAVRTQYLGTLEGQPCYSAEISPDIAAPAGMSFRDLRSTFTIMEEDLWLLAGRALQIVNWDQTHQYCGRCGQKTETLAEERAKRCPACGFLSYPRISPAVITAVFKDDKILLSHNATFPGKWHSICAGFVEPGETLEECVRREIREELGIEIKNIKYFGSQPWPFPNSLMLGFTANWAGGELVPDGKEIVDAGWFTAGNMPEIPPKISIAREIIDWYLEGKPGQSDI